MGVKSTVRLTRRQAEDAWVALRLRDEDLSREFRAEAVIMGTVELEDKLEALNDKVKGGEGFENYLILE